MRLVQRNEILDYKTYEDSREQIRDSILRIKRRRRIHVGPYLTFLFENHDTMRYQILEMVRIERLVRESEIQHEIETYNDVLGSVGEIGCTLLIEIDDPQERQTRLSQWLELPKHLYVTTETGEKVYARFDPRQVGQDRLSSVQYLKFNTQGRVPWRVGCDFEGLTVETVLTDDQRSAIAEDLSC